MSHTVLQSSSLRGKANTSCRVVSMVQTEVQHAHNLQTTLNSSIPLLAIPTSNQVHIIRKQDLMLVEGNGNYTTLYLENGKKITASRCLKQIEKNLSSNNFLRIHQSYIVNKIHVTSIQKDTLQLSNGRTLNIARSRRKVVHAWLTNIRIF